MKINKTLMLEIIGFIREYQQTEGKSPSFRTIMKKCRISSLSVVRRYVQRLKDQGELESEGDGSIALDWRLNPGDMVSVPLVGTIPCGQPVLAIENYESTYRLPAEIIGSGEYFMLKAKGDSMTGANIFEDDYLVICKQETADSGDIVVALKESDYDSNEEATLKRYIIKSGRPTLHPENEKYRDIDARDFRIIGKLKSIIRNI